MLLPEIEDHNALSLNEELNELKKRMLVFA